MQRFAVIVLCLMIAACGFRPLYQNTNTLSGGTSALDTVNIDLIANAPGMALRNALIDRFYNNGYPSDPRYDLSISLEETSRDLAIRKDDTATRAQLVMRMAYRLKDRVSQQVVDQGEMRSVSSYNVLASQYTTVVTQADARDAAIRDLADKLTLRTAVVLQK
jgi:LPS-assembly lipoprotein